MTIEAYLEAYGITETDLGNACRPRVRQSTINRLINRKRTASVNLTMRLVRASKGQISAEDVPMSRASLRTLTVLRASARSAA